MVGQFVLSQRLDHAELANPVNSTDVKAVNAGNMVIGNAENIDPAEETVLSLANAGNMFLERTNPLNLNPGNSAHCVIVLVSLLQDDPFNCLK